LSRSKIGNSALHVPIISRSISRPFQCSCSILLTLHNFLSLDTLIEYECHLSPRSSLYVLLLRPTDLSSRYHIMIRFEGMSPDVMEAICTPMHQILPVQFPSPSMPPIQSVANTCNSQPGSLYLGSMSATMDRELLSNHQITHVVQVLDVPWLPISEKDGFRCLRIDILDKPSADLRPHLEGACQYIAHALQNGGNVLVHCQQVSFSFCPFAHSNLMSLCD